MEARVTEVESGHEVRPWHRMATSEVDGRFGGHLKIKGGWYRLEVRATKGRQAMTIASCLGTLLDCEGQSEAVTFGFMQSRLLQPSVAVFHSCQPT